MYLAIRVRRAAALIATSALVALTGVALSGVPAQAAPPPPVTVVTEDGTEITTTTEQMDAATCKETRKKDKKNSCVVEEVLTVSPPVDPNAEASAEGTMSLMAYTPRCRDYEMLRRPRDGSMMWQISHKGRWCYNGSLAWTGGYLGYGGYHTCGHNDGGVFYAVSRVECGTYGSQTTQIRHNYVARVTAVAKGVPLGATYELVLVGRRDGTYSKYGL